MRKSRSIKEFWSAQPLFRKIYLCGMLFIGIFALMGETGEHIVSDILHENGQMLSHIQNMLLWGLFTVLVAAAECFVLIRFLKKVIGHFTSAIHQLAAGELSARIAPEMAERKDEIGLLARAFNRMAEQQEQEAEREKALLAAVSHELRSPLTRLSVSVELLRREQGEGPLLERLSLETERMDTLIGSILEYSRIKMSRPVFEALDLAGLVREVVDDARFEGSARGCRVTENLPERLWIGGNADMLKHAVENVLRNALSYTADDGCIAVSLISMSGVCRIIVEDDGPGVPETALGRLFRPFFRVDASRQRVNGGTGMGLSISESAIRAHHGRIWAENRRQGGLAVIMELPLPQEKAER